MSMVQPSAGTASAERASVSRRHVAPQDPIDPLSSDASPIRRVVHGLAALLCATGLLALTGVGTLAAPSPATDAATETYQFDEVLGEEAFAEITGDDGNAAVPSTRYIADFALQFVGYPYVWAGNTPGGFDCSGFTQYVFLNAVGIDIGHSTAGQMNYGSWVDWGAWVPGDLVVFAGTYAAGISHVGIYIGDGQFVHAENESTGVTISSLYSDYYAGHYYGAVRIG